MQNTSSNTILELKKLDKYNKRVIDIEDLIQIMLLFPENDDLFDDVMKKLDTLEQELNKELK